MFLCQLLDDTEESCMFYLSTKKRCEFFIESVMEANGRKHIFCWFRWPQ